jgi:hypothetical protein
MSASPRRSSKVIFYEGSLATNYFFTSAGNHTLRRVLSPMIICGLLACRRPQVIFYFSFSQKMGYFAKNLLYEDRY